ncbi:MAG: L-threonylcarbamoyladenylate synthase [Planctomycetota bacterium]
MSHSTVFLRVHPSHPEPDIIQRVAEVLRAGGLVAFPTETVYGLGANALSAEAVARIFTAKGRPSNNPIIVHVADAAGAKRLVESWPDEAQRLAERFWPGPLTLVLKRRSVVPDIVTAGGETVGVRVPANAVALALLKSADVPIAAPSANQSSNISPTTAEHVRHSLDGRIDMILDGGPTIGGVESTVLDLSGATPCILRPGLITAEQIGEALGRVISMAARNPSSDAALRSPGLLERHYAPKAVLECVAGDGIARVNELLQSGKRVGWLAMNRVDPIPSGAGCIDMPTGAPAFAARLYAALHELDAAGVETIVASQPPDGPEWLAVRDRLGRAARQT